MTRRPCDGVIGTDIWLFEKSYRASAVRKVWPFDPGEFCWADRALERLFEGAYRIDAAQAVERSLGYGTHTYKPTKAAELLRWAEQQHIVEQRIVNGARSWRRLRHGVTFVHRLALAADVRTAQQFINGLTIDVLISREVAFRSRKRQLVSDFHLKELRIIIDSIGGSARIAPRAFDREGWIIEYAWQLREELDGLVHQLPLYRLIQVVDEIRHRTPEEDIYFSPPELDNLKL